MNLPEHGSEDVSSILAVKLEYEPVKTIKGIHQVEPDANIYWLIDVEFSRLYEHTASAFSGEGHRSCASSGGCCPCTCKSGKT